MPHRHPKKSYIDRVSLLGRIWRGPERWLGLAVIVFIAFSALTYSRTVAEHASRLFTKNKYLALVDGMLNPLRNGHILLHSGLPIYNIKIGSQEWNMLQHTADEAIARGWMNDDLKTWVPATFIYEGEVHQVEMRLRGDLSRHWTGPKKSYRIKFNDDIVDVDGQKVDRYFNGKRQINLIIPQDKLFALGPFVNSVLRDKGLVAPADRFVILRINGVIHGLYYEVEHFDKPLLAGHERPETTVFGLNTRAQRYERYTKLGTSGVTDGSFDVGSLRRQVEPLDDLGLRAMQVLIDHAENPTPENFARVRAVIDWDKYLYFRCMTSLCNTTHVRFGSDNLKLYYDPSRGLLEPVPWDVLMLKLPNEPATFDFYNAEGTDPMEAAVLRAPELRLRRNQLMWQLVGDGGDSLLARYDRIAAAIRLVVWADVLNTPIQAYKMDMIRKTLAFNIRRIHHVLAFGSGNMNYRLDSDSLATLEFAALNASGVHLQEIALADSAVYGGHYRLYADHDADGVLSASDSLVGESDAQDGSIAFVLDDAVLPEIEYGNNWIKGRYWEFFEPLAGRRRWFLVGNVAAADRSPLLWTPPVIDVTAMNSVTEEPIASAMLNQIDFVPDNTIGVTCYDASDPYDLEAIDASLAEFLRAHPQFQASAAQPGAAELRGDVTIAGTVIVSRQVPLVVAPGTVLTLDPGAAVLCYGGLTCMGTESQRIRIQGRNGRAWGTFAAVRPQDPVRIHYTDFSDGGQKQANGILFTGGLAVHEGDLELSHCRFTRMQSEDAINIKSGKIHMRDCLVEGTASDAIDIDAGTGEVRGNRFVDIAGDGIDVSYSQVTLRDNELENVRDKGISVGEKSQPLVENNVFRDCRIAISCKDLSFATVRGCTFVSNQLAIEVKRKKP
ncbi:MAG: right-handed parallel beta-helix repeat-containing protein, partial [Betaproteobacteria bacterium]